jgi:hypothetical protein
VLALRHESWKYIEPGQGPVKLANTNTETGTAPDGFLFNLADDLAERRNLIREQPQKAEELALELKKIREAGRSRP